MGSGIAQCAAQHGFEVILFDLNETVLQQAQNNILKSLSQLLEKNKISETEKTAIEQRLTFTSEIDHCKASLIIEAIVEKAEIKISLFNQLAAINPPDSIFASNTSSLSVNQLQDHIPGPERVAGLHFFNPATLMKLVEVVKARSTSSEVNDQLVEFCHQLNKIPVVCIDAPGFIVNRVARHYYLEAMRMVEQGVADYESIDMIMEASGFKMGPFKLMDLIGMDINLAVSQSLYEALDHASRLQPSVIQINKVKQGELGRKTGKGFYEYGGSQK